MSDLRSNGLMAIEVLAILLPTIGLLLAVLTVIALHKRDLYFWSMGSTWVSVIACPGALVIASLGGLSNLHSSNAPLFQGPIIAGTILYATALCFGVFYNYKASRSVALAVATSLLQQVAVLGVIFLFLRWRGEVVNRQ